MTCTNPHRPFAGLAAVAVLLSLAAGTALAAFPGTELYLPMVGRAPGVGTSNWYTAIWAYNPSATEAHVSFYLLERNKNNTAAVPFNVTIQPGETLRWDDALTTMFAKAVWGAIRVVSDQKVVVNERFYSRDPSATLKSSVGQDYVGIPRSFAFGAGGGTEILGVYQTEPSGSSELRSNFGFVETEGASAHVRVTAQPETGGASLGVKEYNVAPRSQQQIAFKDAFPSVSTQNARLTIEVTSGLGEIIAYATSIANTTNDPTTYEMAFNEGLLVTSRATGLLHGAVWSPDGIAVEGGLELLVTGTGLASYSGSAGLQCGADLFALDFSDLPATPIALAPDGSFTASVTIPYDDGSGVVFTTVWTIDGTVGPDGVATGNVRSDTSGGTGDWASCNSTNVNRAFRAAWTENPVF